MYRLFYIFLCVMTVGLCGSCNQTDGATAKNDSTALRLGVLPTMECLPFYYSDSVGLFDSLDLPIELVTFDAAMDADTAFMNGSIDGIVSDLVKACIWAGNGDSTHIAMSAELRLWVVTARSARLLKAESLKEKIVGITRHSALDYFTDKMLSAAKLQSIDLNKPQINNIRLRSLMVDQNQYDGAILPEPYASEAVARGAKRLEGTADLKVGDLMCVLFVDSVYQAKKERIDKIRKVYDLAVEALNGDTLSNVLDYFPQEHRMNIPDTLFSYVPLEASTQPNDSIVEDVKKWARGRGLIK